MLKMAEEVQEERDLVVLDDKRKTRMLKNIVDTGGRITKAAEFTGVSKGMHYYWLKHDPEYAAAYEIAKEQAADVLEAEVVRRAVEGVEEPVYYQGKVVGHVRRYSDNLLMFMLKGMRPFKFRDNYNPAMAINAGNINVNLQIPRPEEKVIDAEFKEKKVGGGSE